MCAGQDLRCRRDRRAGGARRAVTVLALSVAAATGPLAPSAAATTITKNEKMWPST